MPAHRTEQGHEDAFTFIDLMVVIATLGLLALMILPALARSGDNGTRMVCVNNMLQLGMASNMYATDNQDFIAWPNWDDGRTAGPPGWL